MSVAPRVSGPRVSGMFRAIFSRPVERASIKAPESSRLGRAVRVGLFALAGLGSVHCSSFNAAGNKPEGPLTDGIVVSPGDGLTLPPPDTGTTDALTPETQKPPVKSLYGGQFVVWGGGTEDTQEVKMPSFNFKVSDFGSLSSATLTSSTKPALFDPTDPTIPCVSGALPLVCTPAGDAAPDVCKLDKSALGDPEGTRLPIAFLSYQLKDNITGATYSFESKREKLWTTPDAGADDYEIGAVCGDKSSGHPVKIDLPADLIHNDTDKGTYSVDLTMLFYKFIVKTAGSSRIPYGAHFEVVIQGA